METTNIAKQKRLMSKEELLKEIEKEMVRVEDYIRNIDYNLPMGTFLKRSAFDNLKDKNLWNAKSIMEEYLKIERKESYLSSSLRNLIKDIGDSVIDEYNKEFC